MLRIMGLDLGQAADYTAVAILDCRGTPCEIGVPVPHYSRLAGQYFDVVEKHAYEGRPVNYDVRHLERFPLQTPYPAIVDRIAELARMAECRLVVDATGVGAPVVDTLRQRGLNPMPILITGGDSATFDASTGAVHVPKRDLVGVLQMALQGGRLKVAADLAEAETLVRELLAFKVKITAAANDVYGAWREGAHDDLVLAVALAAWAADAHYAPPTVQTVTDYAALAHGR